LDIACTIHIVLYVSIYVFTSQFLFIDKIFLFIDKIFFYLLIKKYGTSQENSA